MNIGERSSYASAPLVIGLAGPIASGKSTVAEMLRRHGAEIIDADQVYRCLVQPGSPLLRAIVERFGETVLSENGELSRTELSSIVFADPVALADLDRLTHPAIVAEIRRRIKASNATVVAIEAVKLAQAGLTEDLNALWLVMADENTRIRRLMSRDGMDFEAARSRVGAVIEPLPAGVSPDVTIDTSCDVATTTRAVNVAWHILLESQSRDHHARLRDAKGVQ